MRPKIVVEISMLIHRKDLYCMWFSVPMFHVGRILTKILRSFFIGKHCVSTFDACQFWNNLNHEYNLVQYYSDCFQANFYKCRTRQNYFLSCNLSGPPVFQCHITQWQFSCIEFFFFLIFAFVYVHLACRCPIVWKINLFFSHIFACACAFL